MMVAECRPEKTVLPSGRSHADDDAAHRVFDYGIYGWVFAHELGHWWQACIGSAQNKTHYQREYDANRIAAAYWCDQDPLLLQRLTAGFTSILNSAPNPIPEGQTPEEYFNANYAHLAASADYTWFQVRMVTDVSAENPQPSFQVRFFIPRCRRNKNSPRVRIRNLLATTIHCGEFLLQDSLN